MDERWITPEEALECSGLGPDTLYKLIADGAIPTTRVKDEILLDSDSLQRAADYLDPRNFRDKKDVPIGTTKAAQILGVHRTVVISWARDGHIRVLSRVDTGLREIMVDAADVERVRRLIELCGKRQGRSVFPGGGRYRGGLLTRLREAAKRSTSA